MVTAPHLLDEAASLSQLWAGARKVRVGFMSKFFTVNHAHGQLLQVCQRFTCAGNVYGCPSAVG